MGEGEGKTQRKQAMEGRGKRGAHQAADHCAAKAGTVRGKIFSNHFSVDNFVDILVRMAFLGLLGLHEKAEEKPLLL